jgi:hypothetical protein
MTPAARISQHAITRYVERVDHGASRTEARVALMRLLALGKARSVPRHWMRRDGVKPQPGMLYVYPSERPGVCLLVRDGTVLTVITRALCSGKRPRHLRVVRELPRPVAIEDDGRRRRDRVVEDEDAA